VSVLPGEGETVILYGTIDVPVGARSLAAYLARPDLTGEWPTVVLVASAWGVTSSVKALCRAMARHGLAVVAPDLYRGEGPAREAPLAVAVKAFDALDADRWQADLEGIAEFVANPAGFWSNAEDGFGLLGFGDGAFPALHAAALAGARSLAVVGAPLVAGETVPLPGDLPSAAAGLSLPMLSVFARDDERFDDARLGALREAVPQATTVVYDAAANYWDDFLEGYDDAATHDTLLRLVGFFAETLPPRRLPA